MKRIIITAVALMVLLGTGLAFANNCDMICYTRCIQHGILPSGCAVMCDCAGDRN